ncbi:hypothetical protein OC846_002515 [Tilletia horrida]|uniref:Uncharacterized protein n=1 Tax=Tilletia horrida TaxID=155126 RepID=A0AAN6JSK6_9BASI|nr:hypothetical protein OC845_003362 [Tilletia horrida]KAK0553465.1 hypothetical protein OC846_002515 [Tilletia horrida]KAK0568001.1 hypothetical protein OC861_002382 [Tilletia horrida]
MRLRKLPLGQHATCKSSKASATTAAAAAAPTAASSAPWTAFPAPPAASSSAGAAAAVKARRAAEEGPTWRNYAEVSFHEPMDSFQHQVVASSSALLSSEPERADKTATAPSRNTNAKGKNKAVEEPQPIRLPNRASLRTPDKGADPQAALLFALSQLHKYNHSADTLAKACGRPGGLDTYKPYAIQKALLAFGKARSQLKRSLMEASVTLYQPSTSQFPMRPISELRDDYHAAEYLLNMLDKRLRAIISRICDARRDEEIEQSAPGPSSQVGYKDIRIYNVMLNLTLGYLDDVPLFRTVMIALDRRQIQPNRATLTVILQHACRRRDVHLVKAGVQLGLNMLEVGEPSDSDANSSTPTSSNTMLRNDLASSHNLPRTKSALNLARLNPKHPRSHSHPLVRLIAKSVQARDSYMLVALIETLDTFGIPHRSSSAAEHTWKTPWPILSASSIASLLYPGLHSRGRSDLSLANNTAAGLGEEIVKEDQGRSSNANAGSLLHRPGNVQDGLPQYHPYVLTAVLTALSNEGRTTLVTRLWKLIKQLSQHSLDAASTPGSTDHGTPISKSKKSQKRETQQSTTELDPVTFAKTFLGAKAKFGRGAQRQGWLIPVRAATVYAKSLTLFLVSHAGVVRRKATRGLGLKRTGRSHVAGLTSPSSPSAAVAAVRTMSEQAVGTRSRQVRTGMERTCRRRAAVAHAALATCYLFLRKHWGLEDASAPRQDRCSTDDSSEAGTGSQLPAGNTTDSDLNSSQPKASPRPGSDLPDKYFFAVMLNCWLPRHDGPLPFVDWRMIVSRLRKRFPDGFPSSDQVEDRKRQLSQLLQRYGLYDEGVGRSGNARSGTEAKKGITDSGAPPSHDGHGGISGGPATRLPIRKRRILQMMQSSGSGGTAPLSATEAHQALVNLVLADLQTLGIELSE